MLVTINNVKARRDGEWIRCGKCGRKLFRADEPCTTRIEIKCHSCKTIEMFVEYED